MIKRTDVSIFDIPESFRQPKKNIPSWLLTDLLFDIESDLQDKLNEK